MYTIRSMTNDDLLPYEQLSSLCFSYKIDDKPPEPLPEAELHIRMGAFDETGRLLSAMMQIPLEVRFCGQTVKYLGIGGVVTDPVARKGGTIRKLFEEGLPRLYHEGHVLSGLYPFSFRFYGKFGYTWVEAYQRRGLSVGDIRPDLLPADEIVRVLPDGDDQGMKKIYEAYIADKNIAFLRDDWKWKELRKGTPWADMKHAYVLKIAGEPVAYWIGTVRKESEAVLAVSDMAWTCPRGRDAIFAMWRSMNELSRVEMSVGRPFDLRAMASEAYDVRESGSCPAMFRVINAEKALALLPAPIVPGKVSIALTDKQIPENNGTFTITGDGEKLTVCKDESAVPDLACDVNGLSALVAGRSPLRMEADNGTVQVLNANAVRFAELLFAPRALHMNQYF